jgi:2-polyprenyl-6-methoxyphenol hydroxylase-like FAD-dependent oxidoreductase
VIGGSMSGLLAGLLLLQRGWEVEIFERVDSELAGRGAGIVAQPTLIAILRGLRIDARDLGVHIKTRKILDQAGALIATLECPQVLTAWERVYRLLRDDFPPERYHRGKSLTRFEQSDSGVRVYFHDGETRDCELLVGADGLRSTVRQQSLPNLGPLYSGYVAWRALMDEATLPRPIHREVFDHMAFCLPPGEQFLGYPIAGPDNDLRFGHRRYNIIWYRPADEQNQLAWLLTDESGHTHAISIPPPLIRREAIAQMREAAERLIAPQFRDLVRLIEVPFLQPIYDLETPQMAFGRAAIIGDAAFVARPHVAAGVSKAAEDALALAEALAAEPDVAAALRRFEAERLSIGQRIIQRARHLGAFLQAQQTAEERSQSARHSIPEAVLAETAVLDFLYA